MPSQNNANLKIIGAFATIYLVWGSTFLAVRFAIETIPPILMAAGRFVLAGSVLFTWLFLRHRPKLSWQEWQPALISGLLLVVGGFGFSAWGQQFVPSGLTALLIAGTPIWMVMLEWIYGRGGRPNVLTLAGVGLGLVGVGVLSGGGEDNFLVGTFSTGSTGLGVIAVMLASLCWAFGSIYVRNQKTNHPILLITSMQMLAGGLALLLLGLLIGEGNQIAVPALSARSILSFLYLVTFGSLVAHSTYVWLLSVTTPTRVSTHTFFNPLVAVFLGWTFANERVTSEIALGATAILISLVLVIKPPFRRQRLAADLG